jgi:CBS-domain-containing membrane protein
MRESHVDATTVDELYEAQLRRGAVADAATPLDEAVERLDYQDGLTAIFVVDTRERYAGVVTRETLLEWLSHNLPGPAALDTAGPAELAARAEEATVEDAVHPKSGRVPVEPDEPALHAVRRMLDAGLPVVPVVSPDGSLRGELALARVLAHGLEEG